MSKVSRILQKIEIGKASETKQEMGKCITAVNYWTCNHIEMAKKVEFYDTA